MQRLSAVMVAAPALIAASTVWAQTYPPRPICMMTPFPAGGMAELQQSVAGVAKALSKVPVREDQRRPARNPAERQHADSPALGDARVTSYPQSAGLDADYRVLVGVQRFESALAEAVTVDALWTVRPARGGAARSGRSVVRDRRHRKRRVR